MVLLLSKVMPIELSVAVVSRSVVQHLRVMGQSQM